MLLNKKHSTFLFILLYCCATAIAQEYKSLLGKPYPDRVKAITDLYAAILYIDVPKETLDDSLAILNKIKKAKTFAEKNNDKELAIEMDLLAMYFYVAFQKKNETPEITLARINEMIRAADKANIRHIKIRAMRVLASYYWYDVKNYELAFEQYLLIDKELSEVSEKDYPDMANDLLNIGNAYYYFHEYDKTKSYLERIIKIPETAFNTRHIAHAKNTLALCYRKEKDYEKAAYFFNEVLKTAFEKTRNEWDGIIKGNLGGNYYLQKDFDKAIPFLKYNSQQAEKYKDYDDAAGSQISLADIYTQKNELKTAWDFIERAQQNISKADYKVNVQDRRRQLFPILSKWYAANNQIALSRIYFDSTIKANNEYYENFNAVKILRAQQKITAQEQELKLIELRLAEQRKTAQRNVLIISVIALFSITFFVYRVQLRKHQIQEMRLKTANRELEIATENLHKFTQNISEKNELIEQLQTQHSEEEKSILIHQLQQSTILTDEDWKLFQEVFDKAYPGFIHRVKETYPNLSLGEVRYFVLTKLNLSYKEMAAMMGVSPNTVQVMRHRIRKKMNFEDNEKMEQAIASI